MESVQLPAFAVKPIFDVLRQESQLRDAFCRHFDVEFEECASRETYSNLANFQMLGFMRQAGHAYMGFKVGMRIPMGVFGTFDYYLASCNTLGESILAMIQYFPIFKFRMVAPSVTRTRNGEILLEFIGKMPPSPEVLINKELFVGAFCMMINRLSQGEIWPSSLIFPKGELLAETESYLKGNLPAKITEGTSHAIRYPEGCLQVKLPFSNKKLAAVLKSELEEELLHVSSANTMIEKLLHFFKHAETFNEISLVSAAEALYSSESSIKRALTLEKTSFSQILTSYRKEVALKKVLKLNSKIESVAHYMGYSDRASFERAFKKWYNFSPLQIKKMTQLLGIEAKKITQSDIFSLPVSSTVCQRVIQLIRKENYSINELALVISSDPILTGKLIGVANSAFYGGREVKDLNDAIVKTLGVDMVQNLALSLMASKELSTKKCEKFSMYHYWLNALVSAEAAKEFANCEAIIKEKESQFLVLAALMHNIGTYAIAHLQPEQCSNFLKLMKGSDAETDLAKQVILQNKIFSISCFKVGNLLLAHWGLPLVLCEMISGMEKVYLGKKNLPKSIFLLAILSGCIHKVVRHQEEFEPSQEYIEKLAKLLSMKKTEVKGKLEKILSKMEELKAMALELTKEIS